MMVRVRIAVTLLSAAVLGACDNNPSTGLAGTTTATVRLVNATGASLDVALNGSVAANNANLGYGTSSSCLGVDAAGANLAVRAAGTTTPLTGFAPLFTAGVKYVVVAYLDAAGATQFATLSSNAFTPSTGQGGLRVFDAATGTFNFDVYLGAPGAAFGTASATNLFFGSSTSFFNVGAGTVQVRLTNASSQTVAHDAGSLTFTAGQNYVLVVAPAATGSTALRSFVVTAC